MAQARAGFEEGRLGLRFAELLVPGDFERARIVGPGFKRERVADDIAATGLTRPCQRGRIRGHTC